MLAVVDYGAGNLRSVMHVLHYLNVDNICLVQQPEQLKNAEKIILPGVGAFGAGMQMLHDQGLVKPLQDAIQNGIPYLGICLGMQFLFTSSDEMGQHQGLNILPGTVTRFPEHHTHKVPHMGWNQFYIKKPSLLLNSIQPDSYAYFVHSYYCQPAQDSDILLTTEYGFKFACAVQRDNIYGVQFHPEKSQQTGIQLLRNFLAL